MDIGQKNAATPPLPKKFGPPLPGFFATSFRPDDMSLVQPFVGSDVMTILVALRANLEHQNDMMESEGESVKVLCADTFASTGGRPHTDPSTMYSLPAVTLRALQLFEAMVDGGTTWKKPDYAMKKRARVPHDQFVDYQPLSNERIRKIQAMDGRTDKYDGDGGVGTEYTELDDDDDDGDEATPADALQLVVGELGLGHQRKARDQCAHPRIIVLDDGVEEKDERLPVHVGCCLLFRRKFVKNGIATLFFLEFRFSPMRVSVGSRSVCMCALRGSVI